ncbi:DUF4190 domain-containing protein [Nocardioides albidus]|uniref:DUF4190 domain-containing protein n=1 Tax=Nocardioides albidus TaxID=1517589 RepID=A0A5C4W3D1_9ACTN|nr:DUF4190 domain-containing protein [Nocardioides albidus]TNM42764.1 DUF4190 domain-containing protein [Nocardioides albidus]
MTNPYGGGYPSYEPGPNPYDGPAAGARAPFDGVSIAALVCSLTCCAAPVGIGLGVAGIVRTGQGRRSGRWAAVTGLVVGLLVLAAGLAFVVFAVVMGSRTVWEDEASVGQCIDVDLFDDPVKATCGEPHAGEVIWTGRFDGARVEAFGEVPLADFCAALPGLDPAYAEAIVGGDFDVRIETDSFDEDEPDSGDPFFCYLVRADGEKFDGLIGDGVGTEGA